MNCYDRQGNPMTDESAMAKWLEDPEYKRVAETTLPDGKWISTVWLCFDHQYAEGPPLIFETMVFPNKDVYGELDMDRYSTEEEAKTGHIKMVEKWEALQCTT